MLVRSFEHFPDEPLALGGSGDVLAARRVARDFLAQAPGDLASSTLAVLVLAAACLHADSFAPGEPGIRELASVLQDLLSDQAGVRSMHVSRIQFSAYAAAEFRILAPEQQSELVSQLLLVLLGETGPEDDATDKTHEKVRNELN